MKINCFLYIWMIAWLPTIAFTQVGNYQFSQDTRIYAQLIDGTPIGNYIDLAPIPGGFTQPTLLSGSMITTSETASGEGFPIGFDFVFNGEVFDRFAISTNGYIRLCKSTEPCTIRQFSTTGEFLNSTESLSGNIIIAPFQSSADLPGYIIFTRYVTRGVPGKRGLCIDWTFQNNSRYPDYITYRLILYESSNTIEFLYPNVTYKGSAIQAVIGFKGEASINNLSNVKLRSITNGINTWATSAEGSSMEGRCDFSAGFKSTSTANVVFRWVPPASMQVPYACPSYFFLDVPISSGNIVSDTYINELVRPADKVTEVVLNPTLYWSGFSNIPTTYDVYFGTDNSPVDRVSSDQTLTQYSPPLLAPDMDYFYKVVSKNADTVVDHCTGTFHTGTSLITCAPYVYGGITFIKNITFNTLSYTRTEENASIFAFPAEGTYTTSLSRDKSYNFSYTFYNTTYGYKYGVYVFFDFNQDGDFDDTGERFDIGIITPTGMTISKPVAIPVSAQLGATKMRVRVIQTLDTVDPSACGLYPSGQATQEYTVTILPAAGCENFKISYATTHVDCFNNSTGAINLTVSGGILPYSFSWTGETSTVEDRNNLPKGTYQATATDKGGCTVATPRIAITQPPAIMQPEINTTGSTTFCNGSSVMLLGPAGFSTYAWSGGEETQNITVHQTGSYTLKVKNAAGCESSASEMVSVTANPLPPAPEQIILLSDDTLKVIGAANQYEWHLNGVQLEDTMPEIKAKVQGIYSARALSGEGCYSSEGVSYSFATTGIKEQSEKYVRIYPNPGNGIFGLETMHFTGETEIKVYNAQGAVVLLFHGLLANKTELNLQKFPDGIYYITIRNNNRVTREKIILVHDTI